MLFCGRIYTRTTHAKGEAEKSWNLSLSRSRRPSVRLSVFGWNFLAILIFTLIEEPDTATDMLHLFLFEYVLNLISFLLLFIPLSFLSFLFRCWPCAFLPCCISDLLAGCVPFVSKLQKIPQLPQKRTLIQVQGPAPLARKRKKERKKVGKKRVISLPFF